MNEKDREDRYRLCCLTGEVCWDRCVHRWGVGGSNNWGHKRAKDGAG